MADESRCTCRYKGRKPVIDLYAGSHAPTCMAWCTCPGKPPKQFNAHKPDCGIYEHAEEG